jgi:hypothetical protein
VNWERLVLGPPGKHLGRWRWPLGTVLGAAWAVLSALAGLWLWAGIGFAATVLCGALTMRNFL